MVRMRIQYGCLEEKWSYLITLTLRADDVWTHDASFVARAWAESLRQLKLKSPQLKWFRVIEATKKGTPHLHLIVNGIGERLASCRGRKEKVGRAFMERRCVKDCLVHEWGQIWYLKTGAYITDAKLIYSSEGIGFYLAKYLVKGFLDRKRLGDLGYSRRWSSSRNWKRPVDLHLLGPEGGEWDEVEVLPRFYRRERLEYLEERVKHHPFMQLVGDDLALELGRRQRVKTQLKTVERNLRNVDTAF